MSFDGTDIDLDGVQHATNLIGHGHQTMNDAAHSQFNRGYEMSQTTFAGKSMHAALGSIELIDSNHRSDLMPMREGAVDSLRQATVIHHQAQGTVSTELSRPGGDIGNLINPGS